MNGWSRGHRTYFDYDSGTWRYCDNEALDDGLRTCAKCGQLPTEEGHDACLRHIDGVDSACCGHGVHTPIMKYKEVTKCQHLTN